MAHRIHVHAIRAVGLVTGVLALASAWVFPATAALGPGWRTPIIAFELARHPADLAFLAGPAAEPLRLAMDAGHRLDSVFPFAYGLFLLGSHRGTRGPLRWIGGLAAVAAVPADLWENAVLVEITETLRRDNDPQAALGVLVVATWTKWGAIATSLGAFAAAGAGGRVTRGLAAIASGLTIAAAATGLPELGEAMALGVGIAFLAMIAGTFAPTRPRS